MKFIQQEKRDETALLNQNILLQDTASPIDRAQYPAIELDGETGRASPRKRFTNSSSMPARLLASLSLDKAPSEGNEAFQNCQSYSLPILSYFLHSLCSGIDSRVF